MSKIKVMNEILANKIAAGEVVEKCFSIVKELVENSIDANATEIKVELIESGVKKIKVIDNGEGMDKEDAKLAFQRHASSKLTTDEDLYQIDTLGFRGEALPSIASVSEVELKTSNSKEGTYILIKGGKFIEEKTSDLRKGTTITVSNLFYNTPARLKHLNSLYTELANIVDYVNRMALAYPNIKFSLTNDGKKIFNTDGNKNLLKVINSIYGIETTKKMIWVENENDDYKISGFISKPELTRSNRNHIITLVNKRIVKNTELNRTINDAYHTYKFDNRFPIVVLNIETDPSIVDVNIHPTKMDVKFGKIDELKELVINTIKNKLKEKELIPKIIKKEKEEKIDFSTLNLEREIFEDHIEDELIINEDFQNKIKEEEGSFNFEEEVIEKKKLKEIYPIGIVLGTYIVAQNEDGMFLIDQHAAKERINYEKYRYELTKKPEITAMLIPLSIELSKSEFIIIKENMHILSDIGIKAEEFGINTIVIKEHPVWIKKNIEESLKKIVELVIEKEKNFSKDKFNENIAISLSCKMSIKANTNSSIAEQEQLINDLRKCENPFNCPHGRPTIVEYSKYELEKQFKRSV